MDLRRANRTRFWDDYSYFQKAQTAIIWARNGGLVGSGGFLALRMPKSLGQASSIDGMNSKLLAAVEVPYRDAAGDLLSIYSNVGVDTANLVTIQGVGWAETTRTRPTDSDTVGSNPHAVIAVDRLNYWQVSSGTTFFDLNEPTLV